MEFDQLRYFLKVAERKSFTRAAEELGVTQPALSRSVARLETELGQPVFERQTRSIALTDAGRLLVNRAEQILALVEDAKAEITDDGRSGRVRIGAIPTIAPYYLPHLLRTFSGRYPQASVLVREEVTERLLTRVSQGECDVGILALPIPAPHLEVEELFTEELLLVLPAGHALLEKKRITLADIQPHPFVLLDEAHCLSGNIVSFCRQRSFHPVTVERTNQLATVQELVSLGHGLSLIPAMARDLDTSPHRVYRSLSGEKPTRTIAMVWNPYRFESRLTQQLKQTLRGK